MVVSTKIKVFLDVLRWEHPIVIVMQTEEKKD